MNLIAIPPATVHTAWPLLRDGVEDVLARSHGIWTEKDVTDKCSAGDWMMFAMYDDGEPVTVLVASLREGTCGILLDVGMCWGTRMDEWRVQVYSALETIAHQAGCSFISFSGRAGWSKLAKQYGFSVSTITFTKELT